MRQSHVVLQGMSQLAASGAVHLLEAYAELACVGLHLQQQQYGWLGTVKGAASFARRSRPGAQCSGLQVPSLQSGKQQAANLQVKTLTSQGAHSVMTSAIVNTEECYAARDKQSSAENSSQGAKSCTFAPAGARRG